MEIFDVKEIDNNLYQVRVRLKNKNGLPSMSKESVNKNIHRQDVLKISGGKVVAGGKINDIRLNKVDYKEKKPEIQFLSVPGYGNVEYQFLIEGKGEITVEYESLKAKNLKTSVKL